MSVDYQWLGVGRMRFGLDLDGILIYFTEHNCANNEPNVYMSSPNQPIRYEIRQVGVGSGSFDMICSQVSLMSFSIKVFFLTSSVIKLSTNGLYLASSVKILDIHR